MLNPSMFMKLAQQGSVNKRIELEKISGIQRTRWDQSIEVPPILYQKFNIPLPSSSSQSSNQVNHTHPQQLIDFIGRAYNRCKDLEQKKKMETEIREIINRHSNDLNAVDWVKYPIPNVSSNFQYSHEKLSSHSHQTSSQPTINFDTSKPKQVQKQTISLPTTQRNQTLLQKISQQSNLPQSKAKQIVSKKLQALKLKYEQGHSDSQIKPDNAPEKTFTGFRDERDVRLEMHRQRYEQLSLQNQNKIVPEPIPPHPTQKSQQTFISETTSHHASQNYQPLEVVESRDPQKFEDMRSKAQKQKASQKVVQKPAKKTPQNKKQSIAASMTKQELQNIVRAGKQEGNIRTVAKRFTEFHRVKPVKQIEPQEEGSEEDLDEYKIVGKCTKLDKPYLRITHRPDPQTVRPETILRKAFNHYKSEYKKNMPYDQVISQFRSIRQDLTVQNIRNSFTVEVYEQNFRMSLFQDDTIQMKQCQTNLWQLYRQGLYNKRTDRTRFICYHFICMILQEKYKELAYMLTQIPAEILEEKLVQESLTLKKFLVVGNYFAFFSFYNAQDETCQKLMNHYIDKVRVKFLVMACKTFGEKMSFKLLGENCAEDEDVLEALAKEEGATVTDGCLVLKESYEKLKNSEYLQVKKVTSLLG